MQYYLHGWKVTIDKRRDSVLPYWAVAVDPSCCERLAAEGVDADQAGRLLYDKLSRHLGMDSQVAG